MTGKQWCISMFVVGVLAMQASTFVTGTRVWPFMAYCMYTQVSYGTPSTVVISVTAMLDDGSEMRIDSEAAGLTWHGWYRNFERPMMAGDEQVAREAAERIASLHGVTVRSMRVDVTRYNILPDEGLVETLEGVAFDLSSAAGEGGLDE
ncbi:hypothetical protein ACERK3_05055 [Phycisphaerales bacterium AB-hyl4]|uniref:Uncharacterized protein n=1 Tax=Natronomicrosphaera hydrolytica TaxID=3242702 RepID=A0ABV4U497_9BACT